MIEEYGVYLIIFVALLPLIFTILSVIFITPRRRLPYLNVFFKWLHHVFNFDSLLIERIVRFFYILTTYIAIFAGILCFVLGFIETHFLGQALLLGVLIILLAPIVIRLIYEWIMLQILLVKHVSEIDGKIQDSKPDKHNTHTDSISSGERVNIEPRIEALVCPKCGSNMRPNAKFCGVCGYSTTPTPAPTPAPTPGPTPAPTPAPTPVPAAELICPSCGAKMRPGSKFCGVCGYRVESAPAAAPTRNGYYPSDSDL